MTGFRADLMDRIKALEVENEALRAQAAGARSDGAWAATLGIARTLTPIPKNWDIARLGYLAYLADKEREAKGPQPEPEPKKVAGGLQPFAEPAAPVDPIDVYPPPSVASAQAILRAQAIAEGKLVDLPTDPVARAIIAADRRAREPGSDPL